MVLGPDGRPTGTPPPAGCWPGPRRGLQLLSTRRAQGPGSIRLLDEQQPGDRHLARRSSSSSSTYLT